VRKVLVGLDRSEYALRAAAHAAKLAEAIPGLQVTAVMVVRPLPDGLYREEKGLSANGGYDAQRIIRRAREIFAEHGVEAAIESINGTDPGLEICRYAAEKGCDHIIVGKKGRASAAGNGLSLGSVAYKVLHLAHCPVTIVK